MVGAGVFTFEPLEPAPVPPAVHALPLPLPPALVLVPLLPLVPLVFAPLLLDSESLRTDFGCWESDCRGCEGKESKFEFKMLLLCGPDGRSELFDDERGKMGLVFVL